MGRGKKGKEANANKVKNAVRVSVMLFSVLAVISVSVAVLNNPGQHQFYGNVTVDGCSAPDGMDVTAKIGEEICGSQTTVDGKYGYATAFYVEGGVNGDNITFWVDDAYATNYTFSNDVWTNLDLDVSDEFNPAVINPNANKSIVADGKDTARLNVTVKDHFPGEKPSVGIDNVTIDLSPITGVVTNYKIMSNIGNYTEEDVLWCIFSYTTTVSIGTPAGTYHLTVNATDPSGNYNDTMCITLEVTEPATTGDININEIMYNPSTAQGSDADMEWLELYNNDVVPININSWTIDDNTIITEEVMQPGDYAVLVRDKSAFEGYYGAVPCSVIEATFSLTNDPGDTIILKDSTGIEIDNVTYIDDWGADGTGKTLELNETRGWEESLIDGGTPGEVNSVCMGLLCGDVAPYPNSDGVVNMGDVVRLLNHVGNPSEFSVDSWAGDVNCNGVINMGDVVLLLNHVGNPGEYPLECCG